MATFSTYEALNTLYTSIPEWNDRLDELNGQIALRQIELARLTESERPPTRSIKNKGSTESLRPKDGGENPFLSQDTDNPENLEMSPVDNSNSNTASQQLTSATATRPTPTTTPPLKGAMTRQASHPTHTKAVAAAVRKRKTESLASGESIAPKYRTRSMIIVYYDSAVQQAFEDLVKFVSGSRNAMRKGKMNAKMAEMKRAAELELEADDDDDDDGADINGVVTNSGNLLAAQKNVSVNKQGASVPTGGIAVADSDSANEPEVSMPKLRFVSTRQMGPSRGEPRAENPGTTMSVGMLRGYRRSGGVPDIFDTVDKGLEWVQSQCEHAAHQFLRDGDCSAEISNIKRRLAEVKETAGKEVEKLKAEGADRPAPAEDTRSMQLKSPVMRRELGPPKPIEIDDMEVDEGVDDMEPPKLIFKRSRDIGR
jgi:hypothetical protein